MFWLGGVRDGALTIRPPQPVSVSFQPTLSIRPTNPSAVTMSPCDILSPILSFQVFCIHSWFQVDNVSLVTWRPPLLYMPCDIISNLLCSKCGHFFTCQWYTWRCLRLISMGWTHCQNGACTLVTLESDRQFWVPIFSWYAYVPAFVYLCVLSQFLCSVFLLAPTLFICISIKINAWNSQ